LEVLERVLVNNNSSPTTKQYTITAVIKLSTRFHSPNSQMYAEFNLLRFTIPVCCLSTRRTILFVGHTHTHPFNGPLSVTMQVSRYQKGKAILNFTEARDSEWQWHQPGHMQVHLAPDRRPRQHPTTQFFYRPDALSAAQPTASKH